MSRSPSRRQFMQGLGAAGLGLLAGCGRLPWQAGSPARVPRIGYLATGSTGPDAYIGDFQRGLLDQGYVEGQTISVEYRTGNGRLDGLVDLARELIGLPVDLIVATTTPAIQAAKQAASTVPIVMAYSGDPVANRFVASLARPGGNVTGSSGIAPQLS